MSLAKKRTVSTTPKAAASRGNGTSAPPVTSPERVDEEVKIGLKLKHSRLAKGLRLHELATRLGCTEGYLSKIENDKVKPSFAILHRLVRELEVNIAVLFDPLTEESPVQVMVAGKRPMIRLHPRRQGNGIALERLISTGKGALLEANIHHVLPGAHTDGTIQHAGEELGFVLEGLLELDVEGEKYHLSEGDCFFFASDLKHQYRNPGDVPTRILWVCTPPTF